jgi:hypothetical protein
VHLRQHNRDIFLREQLRGEAAIRGVKAALVNRQLAGIRNVQLDRGCHRGPGQFALSHPLHAPREVNPDNPSGPAHRGGKVDKFMASAKPEFQNLFAGLKAKEFEFLDARRPFTGVGQKVIGPSDTIVGRAMGFCGCGHGLEASRRREGSPSTVRGTGTDFGRPSA